MDAVGFPGFLILLLIAVFWVVPIAAGIWAIVTLHRIQIGQRAMQMRLDAIERALQQRSQ